MQCLVLLSTRIVKKISENVSLTFFLTNYVYCCGPFLGVKSHSFQHLSFYLIKQSAVQRELIQRGFHEKRNLIYYHTSLSRK